MCLCGEYNSISSKTFLINARVDASPFSWEEISNILTGMRRRRCRFNSWIEPIQSTSILPCLKKERKEEGNQQESNKLSYLSTHPSHYYSFFRKNRDDLSKNLFFYFFLSLFHKIRLHGSVKIGRGGEERRQRRPTSVRACGGYFTVGLSLLAAIKSVAAVGGK